MKKIENFFFLPWLMLCHKNRKINNLLVNFR